MTLAYQNILLLLFCCILYTEQGDAFSSGITHVIPVYLH